jgi:peptide deformylase
MRAGTARPITRYGTPVLHRPCAPVDQLGPGLEALIEDMFASMHAANGVGLAANQIGLGLRLFVYDCPDASGENQVGHVINPVLAVPGGLAPPVTGPEGCLSVPGQQADVTRAAIATVTGTDVHGRPVTITGTGMLARCLQHEADHLRGITYLDLLPASEQAAILATGPHGPPTYGTRPTGTRPGGKVTTSAGKAIGSPRTAGHAGPKGGSL